MALNAVLMFIAEKEYVDAELRLFTALENWIKHSNLDRI